MMTKGDVPPLREELSLHGGPPGADGAPSWTIRDPVRNRYFRIGWEAFEILSRWHLGAPAAIAAAVNAETTLEVDAEDVERLCLFLQNSQLLIPLSREDTALLAKIHAASRHSWFTWLLHHYLFFRIPLVRPDRLLGATLPWVRWLGGRWFLAATLTALAVGLFLVHRQWDLFSATLVDTLTPGGLVSYGLALAGVKVVHELAHAYTARHLGCRVPTMGVAFLVMWPMLYTDVNEAWMLRRRRQRLAVGAAGIAAELAVAAWATLAWAFLPEGPARQAAFVLAALTWVSSLLVNLSPFMRFDGYFLAMDALEMPNLHPRAFAMGRWYLRELLFKLGEPPPEPQPPARRRLLAAFAVLVWLYRLVLFLGIAVLVYHFFIKIVGVLLFAVEIGWFVVMPIWNEIKQWQERGATIAASRRARWVAAGLGVALLAALVPWTSSIPAPAMLKAAQESDLYLPFPAQVQRILVHKGQPVQAGQVLAEFINPDLEFRKIQVAAQIEGRRQELDAARMDPFAHDRVGVLGRQLETAQAQLDALMVQEARLRLTAPHDGIVQDLLPDLAPGQTLSQRQRIAQICGGNGALADAYVGESHVLRFKDGAEASFRADSLDGPHLQGRVLSIDPTPVTILTDLPLASVYGGSLTARLAGRDVVPDTVRYRVRLVLDGSSPPVQYPGTVRIDGEATSPLMDLLRTVMVVVVREWGS